MSQLTNTYGLPEALVAAVKNDPYSKGGAEFSATSLVGPPQIAQLWREHGDEIQVDVTGELWKLLGQSLHVVLERANRTEIREKRLFAEIAGAKISGQLDSHVVWKGKVSDWKLTCLPAGTEVLTENGFKPIEAVSRGQTVLGYDAEAGSLRWVPVEETIAEPAGEPLFRISGKGFSVTSTARHRWAVESRSTYKPRGKDGGEWRTYRTRKWKTTTTIGSSDEIIVASGKPLETHRSALPVSPDDAALIGLLCTDGWLRWDRNSPGGYLCQKKEPFRSEIRERFASLISSERTAANGCTTFRLSAPKLRPILVRARFHDVTDLPKLAAQLSPEARRAMLEVMRRADGSESSGYAFCNMPGPAWDAFLILATLEGLRIGISRNPKGALYGRIRRSATLHPNPGRKVERMDDHGVSTVHCLKTPTSTFVIRQGNTVTITGNSVWTVVYGGREDWVPQLNIYAELLAQNGVEPRELEVVAVLRDWSKSKAEAAEAKRRAGRDDAYPPVPVSIFSLPLWPQERRLAYIEERVRLHRAAQLGDVLPCSDEDRWIRKKGDRPTRCIGWCEVSKWCPQHQAYVAAMEDRVVERGRR